MKFVLFKIVKNGQTFRKTVKNGNLLKFAVKNGHHLNLTVRIFFLRFKNAQKPTFFKKALKNSSVNSS